MTTPSPNNKLTFDTPRIYVACLAAYKYKKNKRHGEWIDATQNIDDILRQIWAMLQASPEPQSQEYKVRDHANFCGIQLSDWNDLTQVQELAEVIQKHGFRGVKVFPPINYNDFQCEWLPLRYFGRFCNEVEFNQKFMVKTATILWELDSHIDHEEIVEDMKFNGEIVTFKPTPDQFYVFSCIHPDDYGYDD